MKVLITTIFAYPPRGGVGVYMEELKKGLEQLGHTVDILARDHDQYYLTTSNNRIPLSTSAERTIKIPTLFPAIGVGLKIAKKLDALQAEAMNFIGAVSSLNLNEYDLIHAQDIVSSSVLGYSKPNHVPLLLTIHGCVTAAYYYFGFIEKDSPGWNLLSLIESSAIQQSNRAIVPSEWLLNLYKKLNIPTNNMTVIHNGIDIPSFHSQMNQATGIKSPSNKKVILSAGRLEEVKGLDTMLDALALLKKERNDWVCWIVGSGGMEKKLQKQSTRLGLDPHIQFLGQRHDVPALLKQAELFVLPSLEENYPFSLVEAQVAGKTIIASGVGGITEMVKHSVNGLLVPPGNSEKLYQQIKKVLGNTNLQTRLGKEAQAWGNKHLSLPVMMEQVKGVYDLALQQQVK